MILDKKQIQAIFLFEFRMGCKAMETTHNINNTFGQEIANKVQCSGNSRCFVKEIRALKMKSIVASHWMLTMTNWERSSKLILLKLHKNLQKNSMSTILWWFSIWSKSERQKGSISECPISWSKNQKNCFDMSSSLIYVSSLIYAEIHFSIGLWSVMKSGFYTTTSDDHLSGWAQTKLQSTSQSQTFTKKT